MSTSSQFATTEDRIPTIGIWTYDAPSDSFTIDGSTDLNERRLWSDIQAIPRVALKETRRVVLIGESVARGFLLDPALTPADRLAGFLRNAAADSHTDFEVVDLARTCLTEPLTLMRQATMLSPDAFVLIFGNNIRPATVLGLFDTLPKARYLREMQAAALRKEGVAGAMAILDAQAAETVYNPLIGECCELAARLSTPIVFVVPEHNRYDWIENGHLAGTAGTLAGEQLSSSDRFGLASLPPVPRRTETFANCVQEVAKRYDQSVVDLSEVIGTERADHSMFYDYCHMTVDAIDASMKAVADAVTERLGALPRPGSICLPAPSPDVVARAALLAAIHNAHWGQSDELVAYWLDEALRSDPSVARDMVAYLDTMALRIPRWMHAQTTSISDPNTQLGRVLFDNRPPPNEYALAEMIEQRLPSRPKPKLRSRGACATPDSLPPNFGIFELLAGDQHTRFCCQQNEFDAYGTITEFTLPRTSDRWELVLFLRAGDVLDSKPKGKVALDGGEQLEFDLETSWKRIELSVPPACERDPLHLVRITWPDSSNLGPEETSSAYDAYCVGDRCSLLRVTGRIHRSSFFRIGQAQTGQIQGA